MRDAARHLRERDETQTKLRVHELLPTALLVLGAIGDVDRDDHDRPAHELEGSNPVQSTSPAQLDRHFTTGRLQTSIKELVYEAHELALGHHRAHRLSYEAFRREKIFYEAIDVGVATLGRQDAHGPFEGVEGRIQVPLFEVQLFRQTKDFAQSLPLIPTDARVVDGERHDEGEEDPPFPPREPVAEEGPAHDEKRKDGGSAQRRDRDRRARGRSREAGHEKNREGDAHSEVVGFDPEPQKQSPANERRSEEHEHPARNDQKIFLVEALAPMPNEQPARDVQKQEPPGRRPRDEGKLETEREGRRQVHGQDHELPQAPQAHVFQELGRAANFETVLQRLSHDALA